MYALDVVGHVRGDFQLPPQVADMVVDGLSGVVAVVLLPDQVHHHFVGEHPALVGDKQGQNVKLLGRKVDHLLADTHKPTFQAEVQIALPNFYKFSVEFNNGNTGLQFYVFFPQNILNQFIFLSCSKQDK